MLEDSDGDKFGDALELKKGTDPFDDGDHPLVCEVSEWGLDPCSLQAGDILLWRKKNSDNWLERNLGGTYYTHSAIVIGRGRCDTIGQDYPDVDKCKPIGSPGSKSYVRHEDGGEGPQVLIMDAGGGGKRPREVELLPLDGTEFYNPQPGLIEAVAVAKPKSATPQQRWQAAESALSRLNRGYTLYSWGVGPWEFYCSGLVYWAYLQAGVNLAPGGFAPSLAFWQLLDRAYILPDDLLEDDSSGAEITWSSAGLENSFGKAVTLFDDLVEKFSEFDDPASGGYQARLGVDDAAASVRPRLLVTDSEGRRSGVLADGSEVNEIPGGLFGMVEGLQGFSAPDLGGEWTVDVTLPEGVPPRPVALRAPGGETTRPTVFELYLEPGTTQTFDSAEFVTPPTPPSSPTSATAVAGNQSATVSWEPSSGTVASYEVKSDTTEHRCLTSTANSCEIVGLTNGVPYTFSVRAAGPGGTSDFSSPTPSITPNGDTTAPGAPAAVAATGGNAQANVSWTAPANNGGSPISGYTVTSSPGAKTCTTTGALTCAVTGLTNGTSYTFTVRATNSVGEGPASAPSASVTPTGDAISFSDVPGAHPFYSEIMWLASTGITTGYVDGTFRPSSPVTRQAMASFLYKYEGQPEVTLTGPFFADVPADHPFYDAIQWMAETGLSTGSPNPAGGKPLFKPSDKVSRQAMAAFLWRNAGEPASGLASAFFSDVGIGSPFYNSVQWMADSGLSTGTPNLPGKPLYRPSDAVSRQAMAAFLFRYDQL